METTQITIRSINIFNPKLIKWWYTHVVEYQAAVKTNHSYSNMGEFSKHAGQKRQQLAKDFMQTIKGKTQLSG